MAEEFAGAASAGSPMQRVLRLRDFRLLWLGQATSLLGDQFHFIALSWLVLQLTGDPLALGLVLALAGIPRAIFTLVGGAVTDRFSPRAVMLISDIARLVLTAVLAVLVLTGTLQVWMLYGFAFVFGFVSGFFMPAAMAILPAIVPEKDLQGGNALEQGTAQIVGIVGPVLAGGLIALFTSAGQKAAGTDQEAIGLALVFDALTFAVSVVTLWLIRTRPVARSTADGSEQSVWQSMKIGLRYAWERPILRMLLILIAALNVLTVGPLVVGIPVLANERLAEGAAGFGIIMAAISVGNLIGIVVAGMVRSYRGTGVLTLLLVIIFGAGMIAMGFISSTWTGATIMLLMGLGNGYLSIRLITYLQLRTPADLLGRIMSLILFANIGLAPLSQAAAGALSKASLTWLFVGVGLAMFGVAAWLVTQPALRLIDREMGETPVPAADASA